MLGAEGGRGSGRVGCAIVCAVLGVLLRSPLRGHFMCPFDIVGLDRRYLQTVLALRCGAPWRNSALVVFSRDVMGGLHRLWCMNFTALALFI
jgi:hypothetical protein